MQYNPSNWYWVVAESQVQVYSSARAAYVAITDAEYAAWLQAGGRPTPIAAEADLQEVLTEQYPAGWPTPQTVVAAALAAGLAITSASAPAVNGTYATDQVSQAKITAVATFVLKTGVFPGANGTQLAYPDLTGALHLFPSLAIWGEFEFALANYVADLDLYAAGAPGATLPSPSVTIA